jgi:hypothetical protein
VNGIKVIFNRSTSFDKIDILCLFFPTGEGLVGTYHRGYLTNFMSISKIYY